MRYFYTLNDDGTIFALYSQITPPSNSIEIEEYVYKRYISIIERVIKKEGYEAILHMKPDYSYTVEYIPLDTPSGLIGELVGDSEETDDEVIDLINALIGEDG